MEQLVTFKPFVKRSVRIENPSKLEGQDTYLDVPCSANHFVRKRFRNDWTLRTIAEYRSSKCCYFVTLTFNEFWLPHFIDGRPCFCTTFVTNFFKRFRQYLWRKYFKYQGYSSAKESPIKEGFRYFLCSEYGKTTKRPHHHALFFFDVEIPHNIVAAAVADTWYYGFTDVEVPKQEKVISYVTKYVCKDMFSMPLDASSRDDAYNEDRDIFIPNYFIKNPDYKLGDNLPSDDKLNVGKIVKLHYTLFNFHRQSLGFGKGLDVLLTPEILKKGVYETTLLGQPYFFAIPKYYLDRFLTYKEYYLMPDGSKHSITHRNELGIEIQKIRKVQFAENMIETAQSILSEIELNSDSVYFKLGLDIDPDLLSLEYHYNRGIKVRDSAHDEFVFFISDVRYRPLDTLSPDGQAIRTKYDRFIDYIQQILYELSKLRQRADEREEFKNLLKKSMYGRSY